MGGLIDFGKVTGSPGADGARGQDGQAGQDGKDGKDGLTTSVNGIAQVNGEITLDAQSIGTVGGGTVQGELDQASSDISVLAQRTATDLKMAPTDATTIKAAMDAANAAIAATNTAIAAKTDKITPLLTGIGWGASGCPNITVPNLTNYAQLELLTWLGITRIPRPPEDEPKTVLIWQALTDGTLYMYSFRIGRSGNVLMMTSSRNHGLHPNGTTSGGVNGDGMIVAIRGVNP